MRSIGVFVAGATLTFVIGCSSLSTVNPRAVTVDDVISMTRAGVGAKVITRQIEATRSTFALTAGEIVRLKKEGVADEVLTAMIDSDERQSEYENRRGISPYDFWFDYSDPGPYGYGYPAGYWNPYLTYRQPGVIGRFYRYYPLYRSWDPYYESRREEAQDPDDSRVHPGTGQPYYPPR